jgi:cyclophilin family peptidyl-prolyl cis-trans isomerase
MPKPLRNKNADRSRYVVVADLPGRWRAEIIAVVLREEGIDVMLVEEAIHRATHMSAVSPVQVLVPRENRGRALELVKPFYRNQNQDYPKESSSMANKKKIEEREKVLQAKQTEQTIQRVGIVVIALVVVGLIYMFAGNRPSATEGDATVKQYSAPPEMTIDPSKNYFATFKMQNGGEFVVELFASQTPVTVNNFVFLARDGYYDGVTFHRVLEGFMAQGGDPSGTGAGSPGYAFEDEIVEGLVFDREGLLAMANSGPNTNGSQFFITYAPTTELDGLHTIFGQVIEGMDVVRSLTPRDPNAAPAFPGDAIETIEILEE